MCCERTQRSSASVQPSFLETAIGIDGIPGRRFITVPLSGMPYTAAVVGKEKVRHVTINAGSIRFNALAVLLRKYFRGLCILSETHNGGGKSGSLRGVLKSRIVLP